MASTKYKRGFTTKVTSDQDVEVEQITKFKVKSNNKLFFITGLLALGGTAYAAYLSSLDNQTLIQLSEYLQDVRIDEYLAELGNESLSRFSSKIWGYVVSGATGVFLLLKGVQETIKKRGKEAQKAQEYAQGGNQCVNEQVERDISGGLGL